MNFIIFRTREPTGAAAQENTRCIRWPAAAASARVDLSHQRHQRPPGGHVNKSVRARVFRRDTVFNMFHLLLWVFVARVPGMRAGWDNGPAARQHVFREFELKLIRGNCA